MLSATSTLASLLVMLPVIMGCTPTAPYGGVFSQTGRPSRGINLGDALEAPAEGEWDLVLEEVYFGLIRDAGFDAVRIPIRWSAHAADAPPYSIDDVFFDRVDWAVEQALSHDLVAIIDMHHYDQMIAAPQEHKARFLALWEQIATHYQGHDDGLYFEILNEPNDGLYPELWNQVLTEALAVIRRTNPERLVIVGPGDWNDVSGLESLRLPEHDERIVVTFHHYDPFEFTHQGAEWVEGSDAWAGTEWSGSAAEKAAIRASLDVAVAWADAHDRELYLGEFGAIGYADMSSRVRWTRFLAREAEARGISWAYWEFGAGFGGYDREASAWREDLLRALIPGEECAK